MASKKPLLKGNIYIKETLSGGVIIKNKKKEKVLSEKDLLKIEIAKELGLWEQIEREGWDSLSNAACGRIGGIMSKRLRGKKDEKGGN